jgi:hypothetical protein
MRWQSDLAKRWRTMGLFSAARSTQGEQVRQAKLGPRPSDIEGTPFAVEAKHGGASPLAALRQAETEAAARGDVRAPIAVVRPPRAAVEDAVVVLRLREFEELCAALEWEELALEWAEELGE